MVKDKPIKEIHLSLYLGSYENLPENFKMQLNILLREIETIRKSPIVDTSKLITNVTRTSK